MKILFIYSYTFPIRTWTHVANRLRSDGIDLGCLQQQAGADVTDLVEAGDTDLLIGDLARNLPGYQDILCAAQKVTYRLSLNPAETPQDFSMLPEDSIAVFKQYLARLSKENYYNGLKYLAARVGKEVSYKPVKPVRTHGIYHPAASQTFVDTESYLDWFHICRNATSEWPLVGILSYYEQIVEHNTAEIDVLISTLEAYACIPLCVFCEGMPDRSPDAEQRYPWLPYFQQSNNRPEVLLNLLAGRLVSNADDIGILKGLNVPVFQLIKSYRHTPEQWREDPAGLPSFSIVYALAQPEMAGVIEPTIVAGVTESPVNGRLQAGYRFAPIQERLDLLCRRLRRWIRLRHLPNAQKRVTFVLHNNPCKSVEATVGMAIGLNTFESLTRVLQRMKQMGYDVGDAPQTGKEMLDLILTRKAIAEFRWTTVDEIVKKGGALYFMGQQEYENYFMTLPPRTQERLLTDWEAFPGQGMVYHHDSEDVLVITGLEFGNIKIMVQPKRGCYGAKCNGEVCRILHDPELSPTHHWLATYKYIADTSDVVIHFGAEGALEYLPGKRTALSNECFPEISIGELPHLYVYVMDIPGNGLIAKRRGRAVIVDHLTPVYRPSELDEQTQQVQELLVQYLRASEMAEHRRLAEIKKHIQPLIKQLKWIDEDMPDEDFETRVYSIARQIELSKRTLIAERMHVFGTCPDSNEMASMLATILLHANHEHGHSQSVSSADMPDLKQIIQAQHGHDEDAFQTLTGIIRAVLESDKETPPIPLLGGSRGGLRREKEQRRLRTWCLNMAEKIARSEREIDQLLNALDGRYIEPGLGGSVLRGKLDTLPTGRNFYATDIRVLPTPSAWKIGKTLADRLLQKYLNDEGRFPEHVGISLWSSDAFKSDGELLSQILYLLGTRPVWDSQGRVNHVEVIPLEELMLETKKATGTTEYDAGHLKRIRRPRIDVTVQTSGIVRDTVPNFCELLDEAVVKVSYLEEPEQWNAVRKHANEQIVELSRELDQKLTASQMRRMATFRVFSSMPGTYGLGVGLALDASAWNNEKDLAEVYVNWGGYAYGSSYATARFDIPENDDNSGLYDIEAHRLLAGQLATLDVSYMKQFSMEYDILDCGGYAVFQGGMAVASQALGGKQPKLYWGNSNTPDDLDVRDLTQEIERSARAKLLNRHWIEQQKQEGFQGAQAVSSRINNLFKWSATSRRIEKRLFDAVVETYIADEENLRWLRQTNPYALEEITRRILESHARGLWEADPELLAEVRTAALDIEGDMEETMGEIEEDFQGNTVEILTADDVEKWKPKFRVT